MPCAQRWHGAPTRALAPARGDCHTRGGGLLNKAKPKHRCEGITTLKGFQVTTQQRLRGLVALLREIQNHGSDTLKLGVRAFRPGRGAAQQEFGCFFGKVAQIKLTGD